MSKDIKVKNLDIEIAKAERELVSFTREISELNQLLHDKKQKLHSLKLKKRKRTKVNDIRVTDSAVVAYLEKVCNYDMQKIRRIIVPAKLNPDDAKAYKARQKRQREDEAVKTIKDEVVDHPCQTFINFEENNNDK